MRDTFPLWGPVVSKGNGVETEHGGWRGKVVEVLACCEHKLQPFGFTCVEDPSASTVTGPGMELGLEYVLLI